VKRKRLGEILVEGDLITEKQLAEALEKKNKTGKRVGQILVEMGLTTEEHIYRTLSKQLRIPMVSLKNKRVGPEILDLVPAKICHQKRVIPIGLKNNVLWIAMGNPTDYGTLDDIAFLTGYQVSAAIAPEKEILDHAVRFYPPSEEESFEIGNSEYAADAVQVLEDLRDTEDIDFNKLSKAAKGGVIRQLTNGIILNAIKMRASDIHIEPKEEDVIVRYRIDGIMHDVMDFAKNAQAAAISRIKIMANLDITQRRKPQDGRARVRIGDAVYDLRVSSLPTNYGEKMVMRVHQPQATMPLSGLGVPQKELLLFQDMLARPQGLILVTGPTGSGKTTTLYAALNYLYSPAINIVTIEDPIEYSIKGINQVHVNTAAGLTFAKGLRSLLRQDPNVVMIGEIRDLETATIALQAAQTGHLVLSTLHTNDAASAITRLIDLGIEPYVIASSLLGIIAQRLVRKIHPDCRKVTEIDPAILARFQATSFNEFKMGTGCAGCQQTGYQGRLGIYEVLEVNPEVAGLITSAAPDQDIFSAARRAGMRSMSEDGFDKAREGITTLEEILRTAPPPEPSQIEVSGKSKDTQTEKISSASRAVDKKVRRDRIMIVDDDEAIRRIVKKILESEFYDVDSAANGKEGLNKVFENPPDLIIVDYMMPGMSGIEFIEKLKSHSQLSLIPAIMLTATDTEESEIKALTVGADDWIQKPIHKQRLLVRVKRFLKSKRP